MAVMGVGEMSRVEGIGPYHVPLRIQIPLRGFGTDQIEGIRKLWQREQRGSTEKNKDRAKAFLDRICSCLKTLFPTLTCAAKSESVIGTLDRISNNLPEREVGSQVRAASGKGTDLGACCSKDDQGPLAKSHCENAAGRQRLGCAHEVPRLRKSRKRPRLRCGEIRDRR